LDCSFEAKVRNSISNYLSTDSQRILSELTNTGDKKAKLVA